MLYAKKTRKIANIYVSMMVTLLKLSYLSWEKKKIQNSMLANTDNTRVYIYKYDQGWLLKLC